jgi:hypothetical protein
MRTFLIKLFLWTGFFGIVLSLYVLLIYFRPGLVDAFYYRFTTPKAHSLILGASRAAQGIQPEIINKMICSNENKIINHAFAVGPSSYGPNYFREITKKLDTTSTNGLFIISVSPGILAKDADDLKDDSTLFFEVQRKLFVGNLKSSSTNPNFDYLLYHWGNRFEPFTRIFKYMINYKGISVLHADGWLEVTTDMDSLVNNERIRRSTEENLKKILTLSNTRLYFLDKTIRYVDKYGASVLVRMPITKQMAKIESDQFPDFDEIIQQIADKYNIPYFNFIGMSGQFLTVDAYHLYKKDGERFTYLLCDSIKNYFNNKSLKYSLTDKQDEIKDSK